MVIIWAQLLNLSFRLKPAINLGLQRQVSCSEEMGASAQVPAPKKTPGGWTASINNLTN